MEQQVEISQFVSPGMEALTPEPGEGLLGPQYCQHIPKVEPPFHEWRLGWVQERNVYFSTHTNPRHSLLSNRELEEPQNDVLLLWGESPPAGNWGIREPCVLGCNSLEWSHSLCSGREEGGNGLGSCTTEFSVFLYRCVLICYLPSGPFPGALVF